MLTIHKNTKVQRRAKTIRHKLLRDAKILRQMEDISGYSIVVWNSKCKGDCSWMATPPIMPGLVVPEYTKKILERRINNDDAEAIVNEMVFE